MVETRLVNLFTIPSSLLPAFQIQSGWKRFVLGNSCRLRTRRAAVPKVNGARACSTSSVSSTTEVKLSVPVWIASSLVPAATYRPATEPLPTISEFIATRELDIYLIGYLILPVDYA